MIEEEWAEIDTGWWIHVGQEYLAEKSCSNVENKHRQRAWRELAINGIPRSK